MSALAGLSDPGVVFRSACSHGSYLFEVRINGVKNKNRQTYRPRGHRWLVNVDQHKVVEFKPEEPTADGQWVTLRTFHWRPPDSPIPATRRRMARHKAIEAWEIMVKTGWRRCSPPVR